MTAPARPSHRRVVVDGFGPDAIACARLLATEGHEITMVGRSASHEARELTALGIAIVEGPHAAESHPTADVLVVDCWTAETARLVVRHRAAGAHLTSIGELIMERCQARTVAVTGSGGKTTATRSIVAMLTASGIPVAVSTSARAANAWPAAELVAALPEPSSGWLALELTSTHLAYMHASPEVAVVTAFWPDHVELHGSLARYRGAKATILHHQGVDGVCVVNADDPGAATFAGEARGRVLSASAERPVAAGVGLEAGAIVARLDGPPITLCDRRALAAMGPMAGVALTAACAALACGALPEHVARSLLTPEPLAHRRQVLGRIDGVTVVDDSAATTPRKASGALAACEPSRTIVIVGGELDVDGTPVHASPDERAELDRAMGELAGLRAVIAFGPAAVRLDSAERVDTLTTAWRQALARSRRGDTIILVPMFPTSMETRVAFARLAAGDAGG